MKKILITLSLLAGLSLVGCASRQPAPAQTAPVVHQHDAGGKLGGKLGRR